MLSVLCKVCITSFKLSFGAEDVSIHEEAREVL